MQISGCDDRDRSKDPGVYYFKTSRETWELKFSSFWHYAMPVAQIMYEYFFFKFNTN